MQTLFELMRKRGEPITGTPYIEGREVDLYQLYQCVAMAGGSAQVSSNSPRLLDVLYPYNRSLRTG